MADALDALSTYDAKVDLVCATLEDKVSLAGDPLTDLIAEIIRLLVDRLMECFQTDDFEKVRDLAKRRGPIVRLMARRSADQACESCGCDQVISRRERAEMYEAALDVAESCSNAEFEHVFQVVRSMKGK